MGEPLGPIEGQISWDAPKQPRLDVTLLLCQCEFLSYLFIELVLTMLSGDDSERKKDVELVVVGGSTRSILLLQVDGG